MGRVADIEQARRDESMIRAEINAFNKELGELLGLVQGYYHRAKPETRLERLYYIAVERYIKRDQPVPVDIMAAIAELGGILNTGA